jgi:predicted metal-dependent enzyme (double-stranded beta helix superfamily)
MTAALQSYGLRDFASAIHLAAARAADGVGSDFRAAVAEPIRRLTAREDLLEVGLPRSGNNVAESYYLYYDGDLSVVLFKLPMQPAVQPHDHGVWETLFVYRGAIRHTIYTRTDDGSRQGRATLGEYESRVLKPGDYAVVAPPRDIHGFNALTDDTYGITVSSGKYKPERIYFNVEAQTYEVRTPRNLR